MRSLREMEGGEGGPRSRYEMSFRFDIETKKVVGPHCQELSLALSTGEREFSQWHGNWEMDQTPNECRKQHRNKNTFGEFGGKVDKLVNFFH